MDVIANYNEQNETNKKVFGHPRPVQHAKYKFSPKHILKRKIINKVHKM